MKRSAPATGGGSSKKQATDSAKEGLTTTDALTYLREVKSRFANQREIYDQFLEVMKEFKAQTIDTNGVIAKVQRLFTGHPELVMGFNLFLPPGFKIERPTPQAPAGPFGKPIPSKPRSKLPPKDTQAARRAGEAAAKKKTAPGPTDAPEQKGDVKAKAGVQQAPKDTKAAPGAPKQPVEFDQAISYVNKIKKRFSGDEKVYKAFLEILNQYRKGQRSIGQVYEEVSLLFRDQADLLEEFTYFLPDTNQKQPARPATGARSGARSVRPGSARPPPAPGSRGAQQGSEDDGQPGSRFGRALARSRGRTTSEDGANGRGATVSGSGGKGAQSNKDGDLLKELAFFERLKIKLRNKDLYNDILKTIVLFNKDVICKAELEAFVGTMLASQPDMVAGFTAFMDNVPQIELDYEKGRDARWDLQTLSQKQIGTLKTVSRWEKYMMMCVSELDLSGAERCSTSYRRLPDDYPKLRSSGRTPMQASLLNDRWVSVITGSEDYSFKHMRKNQYEDALFRCEDDRFELDMVIHSNESCLKAVHALLKKYEAMESEERSKVPVHAKQFSAIQQRAIKRLYGESASHVFDMLERNAYICLATLRGRLEQKAVEFAKVKEEMEPQWQRQYTANYINSLDHRSFYFKQSDKRTISAKGIIAEAQELAEQRAATETHLATFSSGTLPVLAKLQAPADIQMDYEDEGIHEDCYRLILCTARAALGPTNQARVMEVWSAVMEPLLGWAHRPVKEEAEDSAAGGTENGLLRVKREGSVGSPGASGRAAADPSGMDIDETSSGASKEEDEDGEEDGDEESEGKARKKVKGEEEEEVEEGVEDEEDEEDEEAKNTSFMQCKPVVSAATTTARAKDPKMATTPGRRTLFCHDTLFIALRLHHLLYSRLKTARKCCFEQKKRRFNPHGHQERVKTADELEQERQKSERDHQRFLGAVETLVRSKMDSVAFEDQMRPLLGARAYVTFTLDKLLQRLVKQMQNVAADPLVPRVMALRRYEDAKAPKSEGAPPPPPRSLLDLATYQLDAQVLLQEEACFRVDVEEGGAGPNGGTRIHASLMDPTVARADTYINMVNPEFKAQLRGWMNRSTSRSAHGFLARWLRSSPSGDGEEAALRGCSLFNGLEIKVACASSKVSYVLGTEDVFVRRRRRSSYAEQRDSIHARKSRAFAAWLQRAAAAADAQEAEDAAWALGHRPADEDRDEAEDDDNDGDGDGDGQEEEPEEGGC